MTARSISVALRSQVIRRAQNRCEYCQLSQQGQEATFHIDHILPVAAGGESIGENLALACVSCSLRKSARQTAVDPQTNEETSIFHPRKDRWRNHFQWAGFKIIGITSTGRATADALQFNRSLIISIREEEAKLGRHLHS